MGEGYRQTTQRAATSVPVSDHRGDGEGGPEFRPTTAGIPGSVREEIPSLHHPAGLANPPR